MQIHNKNSAGTDQGRLIWPVVGGEGSAPCLSAALSRGERSGHYPCGKRNKIWRYLYSQPTFFVTEATGACFASWERVGREAYLHISSPTKGWDQNPKPHADFIERTDFPDAWLGLDATVDVEAKEPAVLRLKEELSLPDWPGEGAKHG